ncbi:MAG: UvrD-helicase domain-containing protein, partial [Candidatus Omnitrophota bacterium]
MNKGGAGSDPRGLSFPEVRVVEASAGSGKTYALAKRYVQLVLYLTRERKTPPIHTILAITFTNKAAFEMKERILRFLKELALGLMPPEEERRMLEGIGMPSAEAKQLAAKVIDAILHNYNYFQVETIDKFINSLLVSSAFQIGLTANFRIKTNAREYLALSLDELMDDAVSDKTLRHAFDDFLTSMLLVEARSAWIPREVVLDTLEQLWGEYNTYARHFIPPAKVPADMISVKQRVVEAVQAFAADMPEGAHKTFIKSVTGFAQAHQKGFRFSQGLSAYFEPGKNIPLTKALVLEARHEDLWAVIQKGFAAAAELEVRHLYDPYVRLWEYARQYLERMCVREDIMFLGELNAKARQVYEEGVAPEELYYRLSTRFEHYLFDEFQDTSRLQWENLRLLPEDGIAKGGTLFYVGDKKQAIYSFRGGDTRLFDDVRAQYTAPGYHPSCEVLSTSRRGHPRKLPPLCARTVGP